MNFIYDQPLKSVGDGFAGGEADLASIFSAARDAALYVDNVNGAQRGAHDVYSRRNDRIFQLTGVKLDNPVDLTLEGVDPMRANGPMLEARAAARIGDWKGRVRELAARFPQYEAELMPARTIEAETRQAAVAADERLNRLAGSRDGIGKWAALFAGGGAAMLQDPLQVGTLMLGAGPGAGRTVAARILSAAAREAAVNGAVEAAMQPQVQAWREQLGLDAGFDVALKNVLFAAAFGGALGGAGQGAGELIGRLSGRSLDQAGATLAASETAAPALKRTLEGDLPAARETLPQIREALPASARGALDHAELIGHLDASRPAAALIERHDQLVSAAHRALGDGVAPDFKPDEEQIARIVAAIAGPEEENVLAPAGRSLVEFLSDRGILDDRGELASIGAQSLAANRARKGRPDRRVPLDMAREAAEEAGYIGRAGETQVTTVADLLDAIDTELRGTKIFAREDGMAVAGPDIEAARARAGGVVADIQKYAGPAVDDAIIREAAEIALEEGIDAFDALERVLTRAEQSAPGYALRRADHGEMGIPEPKAGLDDRVYAIEMDGEVVGFVNVRVDGDKAEVRDIYAITETTRGVVGPSGIRKMLRAFLAENPQIRTIVGERVSGARFGGQHFMAGEGVPFEMDVSALAPPGRSAEPPPGWSDAELEAAAAQRGDRPEPDGIDDPTTPDEAFEISAEEFEAYAEIDIPGDDGELIPLEAYMADIKRTDDAAFLIENCKL